MYFQFLIEDRSTEILIKHVMEKLKYRYSDEDIIYDTKSFKGIGHLRTTGDIMNRKSGNLLNDLSLYLKGFDKSLSCVKNAAIIIVLDNDMRDCESFKIELQQFAQNIVTNTDYVFCIAVKEMEAWLLGDENAILSAYPMAKRKVIKNYEQDAICDTWEVLANAVYPGGLVALKKKSKSSYSEIGKAKCEWADKIGIYLTLDTNVSPSFQYFLNQLQSRIESNFGS